jgi:hypothetical protein
MVKRLSEAAERGSSKLLKSSRLKLYWAEIAVTLTGVTYIDFSFKSDRFETLGKWQGQDCYICQRSRCLRRTTRDRVPVYKNRLSDHLSVSASRTIRGLKIGYRWAI